MLTVLTKITAAQNEVALSYHRVRGLYSQAVVSAVTVVCPHTYARADTIRKVTHVW